MEYSSADKRRVFLAYRAIFAGNNAQLRRPKKVREVVHVHKSSFGPLIRDFGENKVIDILKSLLEGRIFESVLRAKIEFPELFRSSPVREVQRTASENDAARSESQALEEIESLEGRDMEADKEADGQPVREVPEAAEVGEGPSASLGPTSGNQPSLYPSYLPYKVQHVILTTTQRILEECCFDFARNWLPSLLQEHGWDCATAVEPTKWTRILAKRSAKLPMQALELKGSSFNEILSSTTKMRHTAVHRLPTTARGIGQFIESAMRLAEALHDPLHAAQLKELLDEVDSKIKAMELNKNVLEDELNSQLQEIHRQREELDKKEKDIIATTLREDLENKTLIGTLLEESVRKIFDEEPTSRTDVERDQTDEEVNGFTDVVETENGVEAQGK